MEQIGQTRIIGPIWQSSQNGCVSWISWIGWDGWIGWNGRIGWLQ